MRPDSPFYWLYLETLRVKERTTIPVLRKGTAAQRRAARRLAEELYADRMLEVAEKEMAERRARIGRVLNLPCECGCGRIVRGGMLEYAHPEDYRDERG